ncbi:MAG TPA: OmpA family protein [Candidatus Sulfotelmatobacter sp.]|jgi:outer membrane protein OmpA-like peptidoglycan-associated protein|nr:OmpA family protein [Candidatus Sulfotelmatobacter sp.]
MKFGARAATLFLTVLIFVSTPSFADDNKPKDKNSAAPASSASDPNAKKDVASTDAKAAPDPGASPVVPAPPSAATNTSNEDATQRRKWDPMPALDGTPGLFTLGSGDTLPKGGFDIVAGVNKFSRMPGDITVLQVIPSFGVGVTNWFTAFLSIDADEHIHVDQPTLLSLNSTNGLQYLNTIYSPFLPCSIPSACPPAYVEDFPFASHNGGGVGEIDLGFKIGLLSERRGKPFSLSVRNDFYIPTQSGFSTLLSNEVQTGQFNYGVGLEASKTLFHHSILATVNWAYRFTRQSSYTVDFGGVTSQGVLKLADQMPIGAGLLIFPEKRFQIISEYDGLIYIGKGIQNTTFGARDPVDSLMGFRLYAVKNLALDVGYRYNLNLTNHQDRNGFVVKIAFARWPEKPLPPDNVTAMCSADKTSVMEGSSDYVTANVAATDANGRPLNYTWTASGGKLVGTGPYVRWDPTGVSGGSYALTARVDNGAGKSASCSSSVTVQPKPLAAPTMSCSANPATVIAGERPTITATVNDPSGTPITYTWQANAGQIIGSGASVQFDTSGLAPATYTVTGRAENAVHSACDCSATVTVQAPAPAPEASKISECSFAPNSARTDNVCKRTLDDVAVRLQTDAKAKIVVVGYADAHEHGAQKLASERAESAKKYLSEKKSVDTSRVEVRANTEAGKEGRRVEIILVPDGATY